MKCVFCGLEEMVEHLFISCPLARLVRHIVFPTYNIPPQTNVTNNLESDLIIYCFKNKYIEVLSNCADLKQNWDKELKRKLIAKKKN